MVDVGEEGLFDDVVFVVAFNLLNRDLGDSLMGLEVDGGIFGQDFLLGGGQSFSIFAGELAQLER